VAHELPTHARKKLKWPLRLTLAGMLAERALRAFWLLLTLSMALVASRLAGLWVLLSPAFLPFVLVIVLAGLLVALVHGLRRFNFPRLSEAERRLDATLAGHPIAALRDDQAIGGDDPASQALWQAHLARMTDALAGARAPVPDLRIARLDPFALRYTALLALVMVLIFSGFSNAPGTGIMLPGTQANAAVSASWEGWIEPPAYTGKPSLYLGDQPEGPLAVPAGSRVTLRFYGQLGVLDVAETVSGQPPAQEPRSTHFFDITRNGRLEVTGPGGIAWFVTALGDVAPAVRADGEHARNLEGDLLLPFLATDDYGVVRGQAHLALDSAGVTRRHGLVTEPEPREAVVVDLPMPYRGDRSEVVETLTENLSEHPFATLPVTITLTAFDAAGQSGESTPIALTLPQRRFLHPLAGAIIEQRRDLLWNRANAPRVARLLRAVSHRPDGYFTREIDYLRLRILVHRLEVGQQDGTLIDASLRDDLAQDLWDLALGIEEGTLADAAARLERAQQRLNEAIEQGASPEELAELLDELREAMRNYTDQLEMREQPGADQPENAQPQEGMMITQDDLDRMMREIEEAMREGRMDDAQAMLDALQDLMENMQRAEAQPGQGNRPGEQAMEGLRESLREQQGLSDEAFRDLQEQRNPNAQAGESQGNEGRDGNQGAGQSHDGQGEGEGSEGSEGNEQGEGAEGGDGADLAERQQRLADELARQRGNLPGAGSESGDAAREALDRARRAMEGAARELESGDLSGALDDQARAMEALREGMRNLDDALAEQERLNQDAEQGTARGQAGQRGQSDPLGRGANNNGGVASDAPLAQGEDPYRRAEELTDELRRRAGEAERPEVERDYILRLLERF
jgi:uncharacterized protein (TIGR02302 family)